jgi:hypothetical protein
MWDIERTKSSKNHVENDVIELDVTVDEMMHELDHFENDEEADDKNKYL